MPFSDFSKDKNSVGFFDITFDDSNVKIEGFAENVAVTDTDILSAYQLNETAAGILVDVKNNEVLFAENAFEIRYPASLTKLLTAYIAVKYCSLDETIICTSEVSYSEFDDAVMLGLKEGDKLTMDQALRLCLVSSYNDAANAIACHVAGTLADFADLMNEEAKNLGATSTNFVNPNGLPNDNHYTSVYDLYLIFNAVINNADLYEIIQTLEYSTVYYDKFGNEKTAYAHNTNRFFSNDYALPSNVTLVGGKTGTTDDAGYCLIVLVKDKFSNPYIAVLLGSDSRDHLYNEMSSLIAEIVK